MAQHAILRFEKHKGNPARPLEAHHERQKEQYPVCGYADYRQPGIFQEEVPKGDTGIFPEGG